MTVEGGKERTTRFERHERRAAGMAQVPRSRQARQACADQHDVDDVFRLAGMCQPRGLGPYCLRQSRRLSA